MKNIFVLFLVFFFGISLNIVEAATETVVIQPGPEDGKDTSYGTFYYKDGRPDSEFMHIGGWSDEYFSYIEFDLSTIPTDAEITDADLFLFQDLEQGGNYNEAKILLVTEEWTELGITKNNNPNSSDPGLGWIPAPSEVGWWSVDITDITSDWFTGGYSNYGIKIDGRYTNNNHVRRFLTSDHFGNPSLRPKLVVTYEVPDPTPEELVEDIEGIVEGEVEKKAVQNSYFAHIKKFLEFFNGEKVEAALNQIGAFLKKVTKDAQQGDVSPETAEELQELGNDLQEKIETSSSQGTVPLMTQIASPYPPESSQWADDIYGDGTPDWCGNTIGGCGCAIASMSMLGLAYGVDTGFDGSAVNPGNMNAWLKANNGYTELNTVRWFYSLQYLSSKLGFSTIQLDALNTTDKTLTDKYVSEGNPVVAFEKDKGHYFLLTGLADGGNYFINDPFWYLTKTTNDLMDTANHVQNYGGDIDQANLYSHTSNLRPFPRWVEIQLGSPAELLLTDSQGRKTGYDPLTGTIVEEIPGSSYAQATGIATSQTTDADGSPKVLTITAPDDDLYTLSVIGTGDGPYHLSVDTGGGSADSQIEYTTGDTTDGAIDTYVIRVPERTSASRAVERLQTLAQEKETSQPEVAARLNEIADKIETHNLATTSAAIAAVLRE